QMTSPIMDEDNPTRNRYIPNTTPMSPTPSERRKPAALIRTRSRWGCDFTLPVFERMRIEHHIDRKLPRESILIRQTHRSKPLGDRTQTDALGGHTLLPFDIGSADDQ